MNYFCFSMLWISLLTSLVGCGYSTSTATENHKPLETPTVVYRCLDGYRFSATFPPGNAQLTLPNGQQLTLRPASAASGSQYTDGYTTFWSKGDDAMLTHSDATHEHCMADPVEKGVQFKARGQEPGWYLEVRDKQMEFVGDYGETKVLLPTTNLIKTEKNDQVIYTIPMETGHFKIISRNTPCLDAMSGHPYEKSVEVHFNGKTLQGCGE